MHRHAARLDAFRLLPRCLGIHTHRIASSDPCHVPARRRLDRFRARLPEQVEDVLAGRPRDAPTAAAIAAEVSSKRGEGAKAMTEIMHRFNSKRAQQNHDAVLSWPVRFARICDFIAAAAPDIITVQELDHMADMQVALGKLGYAVSRFLS